MPITEAAARLAPVFVKHGYAFLFVFRRGQGLSADQAQSLQDVLQHEQTAHGPAARDRLQLRLLTTEQLDDVMAALAFLKTVPGIDATRISIAGHSFGGSLSLLVAAFSLFSGGEFGRCQAGTLGGRGTGGGRIGKAPLTRRSGLRARSARIASSRIAC